MVFVVDNAGCSFLLLGDSIFSAVFSSAGAELFISSSVSSWGCKLSKGIARGINDRTIRWARSVPPNLESCKHRINHIKIGKITEYAMYFIEIRKSGECKLFIIGDNGKSTESPTCFILRRQGWADGVSSVELEVSSVELEVSSVELEGDVLVEVEELVKVCSLFSGNSGGVNR